MINQKRIEERIEALSKISEQNVEWVGVSRRALTDEDREAQALTKSWMEQAGMYVHLDPAGNLIGRKDGLDKGAKPLVIGSHIDSVLNGGKYDGTIGVIGGIEVVQHINEESIEIQRPVEVIAFCEEEGSRFEDGGVFGSRAMTGEIKSEHLDAKDEKGITRRGALERFGLAPNEIFTKGIRREMDLYLEMHIEQGPTLESKGIPIGVISGINGRYFGEMTVEGEANHVGATPMAQRYDALVGASEIVIELEKISYRYGAPAVGTVAKMNVMPGYPNVVPDRVEMSGIDIRDLDNERRDLIVEQLQNKAKEIAQAKGLSVEFNDRLRMSSALCKQHIIDTMEAAAEEMNVSYLNMASGACHDAQFMAELCDMGMIFVRSTGGSHNPQERASIDDIQLGTELLSRTALSYLKY
ncbi:M20 family metallo-hydrolase [Salicibibacter cibi]|uniref:M20 family metallo-hydrolase n=1 Tax=Salicibibacter cibi TaxID=2743001 RepID=A0A7T6Z8K6_9BACI|nr:M20 family metallo-hydrolase [Salicibibacter cibi]QQK78862.1 M20 family metallo-hydrolase [Salicibibacter cibi]